MEHSATGVPATRVRLVTPAFNAGETIDQTILSVVTQRADVELCYHVQDGASSDDTVAKLQAWERRFQSGDFPLQFRAFHFSFESAPDAGMYDAIARGFQRLGFGEDDWLGWINADDQLTPSALPLLRKLDCTSHTGRRIDWITGTAVNARDGITAAHGNYPLSSGVVRGGLCDGQHWEYFQQEGTFFRGVAWRSVGGDLAFRGLKFAGDFNLWRLLAARYDLFQFSSPTGVFSRRSGQISEVHRNHYEAEIDRLVSPRERRAAFDALQPGEHARLEVRIDPGSGDLYVKEQSIDGHLSYRRGLLSDANTTPPVVHTGGPDVTHSHADQPAQAAEKTLADADRQFLSRSDAVIAFDTDWQYPAITEQHSYHMAQKLLLGYSNAVYLAFPWATLIDLLNTKKVEEAERLLLALDECAKLVRPEEYVATVCQHILLARYQHLMVRAGVRHVFWTHAKKGELKLPGLPTVVVSPFPLYPVQAVGHAAGEYVSDRPVLYSFIGARGDKWYLTKARDWILEGLTGNPLGVVQGRDSWHYNDVVYGRQIGAFTVDGDAKPDDDASNAFRSLLQRSVFSLCPSGTGPNTIRLWESMGLGAIPVVISDQYLPPGDPELWEAAVVTCPETEEAVLQLPERLEKLASDPALLERKRHAMKQVWSLYGPGCFIYDVQRLFLKAESGRLWDVEQSRQSSSERLLLLAKDFLQTGSDSPPALQRLFLQAVRTRLMTDPLNLNRLLQEDKVLTEACQKLITESGDSSAGWSDLVAAEASSGALQLRIDNG